MHHFGESLGLAFQIQDDILGIWGDEQKTGKSATGDILARRSRCQCCRRSMARRAPRCANLYARPA
ncbi:MAG: polyprenyl synthetase family protein [Anaerolineae bacterium]|nr:polyprenyl synthetase family protein [Anaerolineae bacterium]